MDFINNELVLEDPEGGNNIRLRAFLSHNPYRVDNKFVRRPHAGQPRHYHWVWWRISHFVDANNPE